MAEIATSELSKSAQSLSLSAESRNDLYAVSSPLYGNLTCQYSALPIAVLPLLEKASLYCRVRAFDESHLAFESIDATIRHHPVVAYEEYLTYWAQWRLAESAQVLEDALTWHQKSHEHTETYGLYSLLRIALAKAEVFTKGDFTKARDSMREVKNWLRDFSVDQYTDLQVVCIVHYYFLIFVTHQVTDKFDTQSFRQIPFAPRAETELNLTQLRCAVQGQGRLRDARLILGIEMGFLSGEDAKCKAWRSLIEACRHADNKEPVWAVESTARSMLAQSLRRAGDSALADKETQLALEIAKQAPVPPERNRTHLTIKLDQAKAMTFPNGQASFRFWTEFCDEEMVKADSSILSNTLDKAAGAALDILQVNPSIDNKAIFWEWQRRYESLLQNLGDVYFLYMSKFFTGQTALTLFDEFGASIRMHNDFHAQYPDFGLWSLLIAGKRTLTYFYIRLGQQDQVIKIFSEISEIIRRQEAFWNESDSEVYAPLDPTAGFSGTSKDDASLFADNMRKEWWSDWVDISYVGSGRDARDYPIALGPQLAKGADPYMSTLLQWLHLAKMQSELTTDELACIIGASDSIKVADTIEVDATLQQLTPSTLKLTLYGTDSKPTSATRWESIFSVLEDWLLRRAKHDETKRHVLLETLQVERLDSLTSTSNPSNILQAAEKILELIPGLCEEARRFLEKRTVNWRNVACIAKRMILAQQNPENWWNEQSSGFKEILDMYNVSLRESRERGNLTDEAATLFYIAQHYHRGALLLRPAAFDAFTKYLDASETVFSKSRESWKVLKGWAKVEKLLSAVQELLRLMIAPLLASVVYQLPDEDMRAKTMWGTIQLAKSNGLGWLMRTNTSARNKRVEDSGRLDVDFDELPTLTSNEFKPITEDAGGNVCYVDWYKPLAAITEPGQTLVLSPFGSLHRLPLHALEVNGELLIQRNPIVYSSSLTVLKVVYQNRKAAEQRHAPNTNYHAALFGDPPSPAGRKALKSLATKFNTEAQIGDASTSSNLLASLTNPSLNLLHYHGHVTFQEGDPKDHGLELDDRRFSLRDVFDLELTSTYQHNAGYHVTLLGCGSGMSKTTLSNDVLGLVSAFLYAGASSVVSALWPFDDRDA
ncbi:MAG: hypothetical protein Q9172_007494, partial [Xanthocarpia lactea]